MEAAQTQGYVTLVSRMDDDTFRQLVNQDLYDQAPSHLAAALRDAENSYRWRTHLAVAQRGIEKELAEVNRRIKDAGTNRRERHAAQSAKDRIILQKDRLTDRLCEVKLLHARQRSEQTEDNKEKYRELRRAIQRHRDETYRRGFEPEETDLELWAVLDTQ